MKNPTIVVAGAGSIGCFVGGLLAETAHQVKLLGRGGLAAQVQQDGLQLTGSDDLNLRLIPDAISMTTDPSVLEAADIILVTVKSGGTADMAEKIKTHARPDAVIISLQNGVTNADTLRAVLPQHDVRGGVVGFNVVQMPDGRFHRGTEGDIILEAGPVPVATHLTGPHLEVVETADIKAVAWGKLLLNLNNGLNALSGLPLKTQLENRAWRQILADQMREALAAMKAAGVTPKAASPLPPLWVPAVLRLPNFLFKLIAAGMLKIDPQARASMWEDLERGRKTEIDELQGAVVALASEHGQSAPVNRAVTRHIKAAEAAGPGSPGLTPAAVRSP